MQGAIRVVDLKAAAQRIQVDLRTGELAPCQRNRVYGAFRR